MQEVARKTWRKEDELKGLKSELAALDRKIQLELAPPTPEARQEPTDGVQQENGQREQQSETIRPDMNDDFIRNHVLVLRPGVSDESKIQGRGMKM